MVGIASASIAISLLVGLIALVMAAMAFRARARSGNRRLLFVGAAFTVFVAKSLFSAYNVRTHVIAHDGIELGLSLFDLVIMVLLFLPLLTKSRP